jgi:1-acyl-sn-glycerol-3-phosphate acyltransferase
MSVFFRSGLYALFQILITPVFALVALATFPLAPLIRYRIITVWSRLMVAGAETVCGIRYRVLGAERIPPAPFIVLANHQSAWETLAFQAIFPPQVSVVKRELLWIPFFGWGLAMLSPIAIDRDAGPRALRQLLKQGRDRLARGFCIVTFPEGTRVPPGARAEYQIGGAWLAVSTSTPVLPVAHNAGEVWRRRAFLKRPGLVTVSVVEDWIEGEVKRISDPGGKQEAVSSER